MAEFCKECAERVGILPTRESADVIMSDYDDLCECCGEYKPVVLEIRRKDPPTLREGK